MKSKKFCEQQDGETVYFPAQLSKFTSLLGAANIPHEVIDALDVVGERVCVYVPETGMWWARVKAEDLEENKTIPIQIEE